MEGIRPSAQGSSALLLSGSYELLPVSVPWDFCGIDLRCDDRLVGNLSMAIHLFVLFICLLYCV